MNSDKLTVTRQTVTTHTKIFFPVADIKNIIRCWVDLNMSDSLRPKPEKTGDISVNFVIDDECKLMGIEADYPVKAK